MLVYLCVSQLWREQKTEEKNYLPVSVRTICNISQRNDKFESQLDWIKDWEAIINYLQLSGVFWMWKANIKCVVWASSH